MISEISPRPFHKLRGLTIVLSLSVALASVSAVQAKEFYQWKDDQGTTHFSDKPPQGVEAKKMGTKARWARSTEEQPETESDDDTDTQEQNAPAAQAQKDPERCESERERLRVLQDNSRIRMQNEDGSTRILTPEEVQEEIQMTRNAVDYFCE